MLIYDDNLPKNVFNINKDTIDEEIIVYLKTTDIPHVKISDDVLNNLMKIAFQFKVMNVKNTNQKKMKVYSVNCKIHDYIHQVNECLSTIDILNTPANIATPYFMSDYMKKIFKNHKDVNVRVLNISQIKKEKLNLLHALGDGNYNKPYFVILERLIKDKSVKCIIGKGITFDSGGVSIKSGITNHLHYMKMDKTGACYAAHIFKYLVENTEESCVCLLPFTENILSLKTLKPGDIIKSHSGKTVEISNTDAEGRLVVADSLSFSERYKPELIVDITTFSNTHFSCDDYGVFFTQDKKLKKNIEKTSLQLKEPISPMPSYINKSHIKSSVADIKNSSVVCGNAYNATMFLHEFVPKNVKWVHFDISNEIYTKDEELIPNGKGFLTIIETLKC